MENKTEKTEIVVAKKHDLQITENTFNEQRIQLIKDTYCRESTDAELDLFIAVCKKTGLSPETRQIYVVKRWDSNLKRMVMATQTSIDGFRLIAERTGKYAGQVGAFWWCEKQNKWLDVWIRKDAPLAAKVGVLRKDFTEPCYGVAKFSSYCQVTKDGSPVSIWRKMPEVMLAKCAESLALRKAFPQELSGMYTTDEMAQAEIIDVDKAELPPQKQQKQIAPPSEPTYEPDLVFSKLSTLPPPPKEKPTYQATPEQFEYVKKLAISNGLREDYWIALSKSMIGKNSDCLIDQIQDFLKLQGVDYSDM